MQSSKQLKNTTVTSGKKVKTNFISSSSEPISSSSPEVNEIIQLEWLDRCLYFVKEHMLYAFSINNLDNPSLEHFKILLNKSQINTHSFALVKVHIAEDKSKNMEQ